MKELLIKLDACQSAKDWAANKSWQEIYNTCHRGDWLLWLFENTNPNDLQLLTLAKGHCANTVRHLMKDERSIKAVDAAIAFGEGRISREELKDASWAARAAAEAAANAVWAAADAATNAVWAARAAAEAAETATYASTAAGYAAARAAAEAAENATYASTAAGYAAARAAACAGATWAATEAATYASTAAGYAAAALEENQQRTADICRKYLPIEIWNIKL